MTLFLQSINADPDVLDIPLTEDAHAFFLKNYFGNSVKLYHRRLTYTEIIENINNKKPITMLLKSESGNGHAVVIVGYTLKPGSASGIQYLKCMEPANGKFVNIPTTGPGRESIYYYRFDGKAYTWAKSITI